jgi:signal transduction histidine kinase
MTDQTDSRPVERDLMADRARELMVLNAVAAAVAQSLEPQPLLSNALDHVLDLLELEAGAIYTRGDDGRLEMIVERGISPALVTAYRRLPLERPAISRMVAERRPLLIDDVSRDRELESLVAEGFRAMMGLPLLARGEVVGLLMVLRSRVAGWSPREATLLEAIADHIALALDNARLFAAEQQRRRQSEALRKGALALTEALGPDAVLQRIVQQATELMEAPSCAIFEYDESSGRLTVRGPQRGASGDHDRGLALGRAIVATAIERRRVVSVRDVAASEWRDHLRAEDGAESSSPFRSMLAAPLLVKGRVYGGLAVSYPEPRDFSADEVQLIDIFADQAALALEHARLVDQSRRLAALEERQRIARDLHDSVTQTLFSLRLASEAARNTMSSDVAAIEPMLRTVQDLAAGALAEMRALIFELRPGALHEAGLAAAIERFVGAFQSRTGLAVTLDLDARRLPAEVEEALYRIASEALHNIGKHAAARAIEVRLTHDDGCVRLSVHDDGVGFDPSQPVPGDHMGQRTMQERAAALGGSCVVKSAPGAGTTVTVEIPLDGSA